MSTTAHLGLVHVEQAQAQKEVTINAALDGLDTAIAGTHTVITTGGTTTLTAAEGLHRTIRVTGTLTSNATIVVPSARRLWGVINATTGSYSVTVKTSSGAGVVIPQGAAGDLVCHDGAEVVALGALGALSVFGRTGAVVAASGDYTAAQVAVTPAGALTSTTVQAALQELQAEIATAGAVSSVHGRAGAVVAAGGDYTAAQITVTPAGALTSTTVQAALEELQTEISGGGGGGGAVSSVHGRAGAVVAAGGDYTAAQITVTPAGALTSTTVQAALQELQADLGALTIPTVQTHAQTLGDGTATVFAIPHNFGSYDVLVNIRSAAVPRTMLESTAYDVVYTDTDNLQITFATAPTTGQYEVFCVTFTAGGEVGGAPLPGTQIYEVVGVYSFTVPGGVSALTAKVWGAGGGGAWVLGTGSDVGGGGGYAQALLAVTPGEVLTVRVGAGGVYGTSTRVSGGGAITGVFRGTDLLTSTPLVIGGSGGGGARAGNSNYSASGGAGGGSVGSAGEMLGSGTATGGGTQTGGGGGSVTGAYLAGGVPSGFGSNYHAGSGGAGYFGGGATAGTVNVAIGGGGGSGYTPAPGSILLAAGAPTPTNTAGSGATPANNADPDYGLTNAGIGGGAGANGNPGRIALKWV